MIHGLLWREPGDRRQNAECIGSQENDVMRMPANAWCDSVVDEIKRIRGASVLCEVVGIEIQFAGCWVHHDVLKDCTEPDGVPDLRLVFTRQADTLGVAASLKIEDAAIAPAVFVVADQLALRVC